MNKILGWSQLRRKTVRQRAWRVLNIVVAVTTLVNVSALGVLIRPKPALAAFGSGAIWTTNETCANPAAQDDNAYALGEIVHVRGSNFDPNVTLYFQITGQPGKASADPGDVVASGPTTTDGTGYFCVAAYTVANDDDGTYTVDVYENANFTGQKKNDNYHVNGTLFGSITVSKQIDTDGNGTYEGGNTEGNAAGFRWGVDQDPTDRLFGTTLVDVTADDYKIWENSQNGYRFTGWFSTNGDGACNNPDGTSLPADISVNSNEDTAITLCNARNVYQITVEKVVVPMQGGSVTNPEGWTWSVDGGTAIEGGDSTNVLGGVNHTITETPDMFQAPGYTTTWQCRNGRESFIGSGEGRSFTTDVLDFGADNGDQVYCRFTNTEVPTYGIHGQKFNDLNGNGIWDQGETGLNGWTIFLDTNINGILDGEEQSLQTKNDNGQDGWYVFHGLPAGTYRICEVQQGGWNQTYPQNANNNCHSMTVGGELIDRVSLNTCGTQETQNSILAPSCNFGNHFNPAKLTVIKIVSGGTKTVADFPLFVGSTSVISGVQNEFAADTYTISETSQPNYVGVISGDCAANGSITLAAGDIKSCTITNTYTVAPTLTITKTNNVTTFVNPGATVTYTVVVTNSASATQDATAVDLTDVLPTGFTYTLGGGSTKTFGLGNIAPGHSVTTTYAALVRAGQAAGTYTNTAKAKGTNATEVSASSIVEVRVPTVLGITTSPALTLTKTVDVSKTNPGKTVNYTLVVTNAGTGAANNLVVTDTLPVGFTFVDGGKDTKSWTYATLAAGASQTITAAVKVGADVKAGDFTNRAYVTADGLDPVNATAVVNIVVPQVLGLATTGAGWRDYLTFIFGLLLIAAGYVMTQRNRRELRVKA